MRTFFLLIASLLLSGSNIEAYSRIVSLKPSATEMIFALGAGNQLVGVTTYCKHPAEARKIAKIGGYSNPNLETIISLKPDLVVLIPDSTSPRVFEALQRASIETLVLKGKTWNDVLEDLRALGRKLGASEKAEALVRGLENAADSIPVPSTNPPRTAYLVVQRTPLMVAGRGTFLSDILARSGLKNLGDEAVLAYPRLSLETLLQKNPDVILDMDQTGEDTGKEFWGKFPTLNAVKNGYVHFLDADLFVPGPRIGDALKRIREAAASKTSR